MLHVHADSPVHMHKLISASLCGRVEWCAISGSDLINIKVGLPLECILIPSARLEGSGWRRGHIYPGKEDLHRKCMQPWSLSGGPPLPTEHTGTLLPHIVHGEWIPLSMGRWGYPRHFYGGDPTLSSHGCTCSTCVGPLLG